MKEIYLAGGCFWGTEHFFKQIDGVTETEVGFANGETEAPTYKEVYTDQTGYAETVRIRYDETRVGLRFLVRMFFCVIDPTSLNRQGHDEGTRYRPGVYYTDETERERIQQVFDEEQARWDTPMVVELEPLYAYYSASDYHQDYLDQHPDGYCHLPLSMFKFAREAKPEVD